MVGEPFWQDRVLVAVSVALAVVTAYASFELIERRRAATGRLASFLWLLASGGMMGLSLWGAHFIGLLAVETPLLRSIDLTPTIASAVIAIACGATGFAFVGAEVRLWRLALAGPWFGAGGLVMHYWGVYAMDFAADVQFRAGPILITAVCGIVSSSSVVWMSHGLDASWRRALAALPSGAIISGLHYTDMASTVLVAPPFFELLTTTRTPSYELALWLSAAIAAFAVLGVLAAYLNRRQDERRGRLARDWEDVRQSPFGRVGESTIVIVPDFRSGERSHESADGGASRQSGA
jgi:NO-binding membrane sensor protein with MHYT domain